MKTLLTTLALTFALTLQAHAAQVVESVAAVINDAVITQQDVDKRFQFILRQIDGELAPQDKEALYQRTIGQLIDEELLAQHAEDKGIRVNDREIQQAIANIERANNLKPGSFENMASGLRQTAKQKVKTEVLRRKVIDREIRPRISISNAEIDLLIKSLLSDSQVLERELSQIFIEAATPGEKEAAKKQIEQIYNQLQKGENFATLARAYSEDGSADKGGYLGWFSVGELSPQIEEGIEGLEVGSISEPIASRTGWHILKVSSQRETLPFDTKPIEEVNLVVIKAPKNDENEKQLKRIRRDLDDYKDVMAFFEEINDYPSFSASQNFGWMKKAEVPSSIAPYMDGLDGGEPSRVIETDDEVMVLFLAGERQTLPDKLQTYRERVRQRLMDNRIELANRRFVRDLRRRAFIDIRL